MAQLTGNPIQNSYLGLLKTTDNAAIGGTAKAITDGNGNATNIEMSNTATNFVSGTVDFTGSTVTGLNVTGDITGSVFGDDSTLIVDGVNNTINGIVQGGLQELVGPGVVNLTTTSTEIVTTGTDAYTLANGTYGQIKHIIKIGGPGAATITPASFANGTSVELASDFNCVSLLYTNSGWAVIAAQNITINA